MKRSKPLRRTRWNGGPDVAREPKPAAQLAPTVRPLHRGTYAGGTRAAAPKTTAYRDAALLEMAHNRPCLLLVPGVCNHRTDTTVAAHSNQSCHGKAGARKADDCYSAWACAACHVWLDQGRSDVFLKVRAFTDGMERQILAWRQVAADPGEPERFRRAAARALERLNTPRP